jgi:hypothetical protein
LLDWNPLRIETTAEKLKIPDACLRDGNLIGVGLRLHQQKADDHPT